MSGSSDWCILQKGIRTYIKHQSNLLSAYAFNLKCQNIQSGSSHFREIEGKEGEMIFMTYLTSFYQFEITPPAVYDRGAMRLRGFIRQAGGLLMSQIYAS